MAFNLIREAWIPARRAKGSLEWIAPWEVTDPGPQGDDPFVSLDAARPDFNGGLIQFLIGLVQTTLPPQSERDWRELDKNPPPPETLKAEFGKYAYAFNLDGDYPRFMQDMGELGKASEFKVSKLLMDFPGNFAEEKNSDFFVKRDSGGGMCPACLAAALFYRQSLARGFGGGYRDSLRTGDPLTTVILGATLWKTIWLNVLNKDLFLNLNSNPDHRAEEDKFSWLGPAKSSEKGKPEIYPQNVAPEQIYWSMSQQIQLIPDPKRVDAVYAAGLTSPLPRISRPKSMAQNITTGFGGILSAP